MSEQKLIAESRTFEQQMIERDKNAPLKPVLLLAAWVC